MPSLAPAAPRRSKPGAPTRGYASAKGGATSSEATWKRRRSSLSLRASVRSASTGVVSLASLGALVGRAAKLDEPSAAQARAARDYERVCEAHGDSAPWPLSADKVLGFLFAELDRGLSNTGLSALSSALQGYARRSEAPLSPAEAERTRLGVKVLDFEFPSEVRRSRPLTDAIMRRVHIFLEPYLRAESIWAASWWALLCLGYGGLYRGGELLGAAMTWEQLSESALPDGTPVLVVDCPFRKVNKSTRDKDYDVGVVPPRTEGDSWLDPYRAVTFFAHVSGHKLGEGQDPVFSRRVKRSGACVYSDGAFPDGVARADLRWLLAKAGIEESEAFGLHSMRRGGATFLLACGAPWSEVKKLGGWRSDALQLYDTRGVSLAASLARRIRLPLL